MDIRELIIFGAIPLVGMGALYLLGLVVEKFRSIRSGILREALILLADATGASVREVQQVIADKAKAAHEDGKLTDEEVASIRAAALEATKRNLGTRGLALISRVFGLVVGSQMDTFLVGRNEAAVSEVLKDPL